MPAEDTPPQYVLPALNVKWVPIEDLKTLPGNPRRGDIEMIKKSLARFGQRYPSVVKDGVLLAGNNRKQAMLELGWTHVAVVDSSDLTDDEARAFALADNHTSDGATYEFGLLAEMVESLDEDLRDAAGWVEDELADLSAKLDSLGLEWNPTSGMAPTLPGEGPGQLSDRYTKKIEAPIYEPKGPKPSIDELLDASKTVDLQTEILQAGDLSSEERVFLLAAAERHTVFRFDRIAEYYAHSPEHIRRLMERSALVIIDFDKAIEEGFVRMTQAMAASFEPTEGGDDEAE